MNRIAGLILLITIFLGFSGSGLLTTADNLPERKPSRKASVLPRTSEKSITVAKGTKCHIRLKDKLSSEDSEGSFSGVLDRPVQSNGRVVLASGVQVRGKFSLDESSEIHGKRPAMKMRLNQVLVDGKKVRIETEVLAFGVPVPDDGARLKALDSNDSLGKPLSYEPGSMLTFKLAEPFQVPDGRR